MTRMDTIRQDYIAEKLDEAQEALCSVMKETDKCLPLNVLRAVLCHVEKAAVVNDNINLTADDLELDLK